MFIIDYSDDIWFSCFCTEKKFSNNFEFYANSIIYTTNSILKLTGDIVI